MRRRASLQRCGPFDSQSAGLLRVKTLVLPSVFLRQRPCVTLKFTAFEERRHAKIWQSFRTCQNQNSAAKMRAFVMFLLLAVKYEPSLGRLRATTT